MIENNNKTTTEITTSVVDLETPTYLRQYGKWLLQGFSVFLVFVLITPWQQTSKGFGRIVAYSPTDRIQTIDAPLEGRIGTWFVQEGSIVHEGDPIVEIIDNDPEIMLRLKSEKNALDSRLEAAELAEKTAKINVERQLKLFDEGISSRRTYEQAKIEHARFQTELANTKGEIARLQLRLNRQKMQKVLSPRSGTILRRTAGEGLQLVKTGDPLATLVPITNSRAIEVWISGLDVPLISEKQKVRIQFEGWPVIQFSGWPSIAVGTFGGLVDVIDAADDDSGKFRVLIIPDPEQPSWPDSTYLRQGIKAKAWIQMNQVTVAYELWRQFNGFPVSIPQSKKEGE